MRCGFFILALLATPAFASTTVTKSFDASTVKSLLIEQGAGKVKITSGDVRQATVEATKVKFDEATCKLDISLVGSELRVSNKDSWKNLGKSCDVNWDITVPRILTTKLKVGAGDVDVTGLRGDFSYEIGSGNLTVNQVDLRGLDGKLGSGNVSIVGVLMDGDLKIGAGNADLKLAKTEKKSKIDVKLGTGKTTISLPKDATVKSSFKAGLGSLTNEFSQSENAAYTISGAAGAGDMEIKRF